VRLRLRKVVISSESIPQLSSLLDGGMRVRLLVLPISPLSCFWPAKEGPLVWFSGQTVGDEPACLRDGARKCTKAQMQQTDGKRERERARKRVSLDSQRERWPKRAAKGAPLSGRRMRVSETVGAKREENSSGVCVLGELGQFGSLARPLLWTSVSYLIPLAAPSPPQPRRPARLHCPAFGCMAS